MVSAYPGNVVQETVGILDLVRRKESRASDLRDVAERQLRQSAVTRHVRDSRISTRKIQQLFARFVRVDLEALRVDPVVADAEFVDQLRVEQVRPTRRHAAIRVTLITREES